MIKLKFLITIMNYNESLLLLRLSFTEILAIPIDLTFQKLHKTEMEILKVCLNLTVTKDLRVKYYYFSINSTNSITP